MILLAPLLLFLAIMYIISSLNEEIVKPIAKIKADNKKEKLKDPVDKEFEKVYAKEILKLQEEYGYFDNPEKYEYLFLNYCAEVCALKRQFLLTGAEKPIKKSTGESQLLKELMNRRKSD